MKKACLLLAAVAALSTAVPAGALEVTGDAYLGVYDKYLWRGFDLSGGKPVVQGGVDLSAHGFTVSYWSNLQARDSRSAGLDSGEITETDITLDYSAEFNDVVSVSVGNIFYSVQELEDTNELYGKVALKTLLSPSLTLFWDYDEAKEEGLFATTAISHTFEVGDQFGITAAGALSYNFGSDFAIGDYHNWHNYELSLGAGYAITDDLSLDALVLFSEGLSSAARSAVDSELTAGITATIAF